MRNIQEIKKDIVAAEQERATLFEQIEPLQQRASSLYETISRLRDELADVYTEDGKLDSIEFLIDNYVPNSTGRKHYDAMEKWAHDHGLMHGGYWTETQQPAFKVAMKRDGSNYDKTLEAVKILIPLLKAHKNGRVRIDIFEHTLSEHYSYHMEVLPDMSEAYVFDHIGKYSDRHMFKGSLEDTLRFIQKRLWYEKA